MTSAADRESGPADSTPDPPGTGPGPESGRGPEPARPGHRRRRALAAWGGGPRVPPLDVGDRILVQKAFFNWHDVRQGDIVVFAHPAADNECSGPDNTDLVKRVVALGGQTIYSSGNTIYVDGRQLAENYLPKDDPLGPAIPRASASSPYRVPAGDFYVLGDNRAISCDSRYWGPVDGSTVVGKAVLLWWRGSRPDFHGF